MQECVCLVPRRALEIAFDSRYTDWCLEFETSHLVSISVKKKYITVWSLSTGPSVESPCDPSGWDPPLSSIFCQEKVEKSEIKELTEQNTIQLVLTNVGCTCTAPVCRAKVFSVLQFFQRLIYERWRLRWFQQPRPSRHVFAWNKKGDTFRYKQKLQYMIVFMGHFSNTDLGASVASSSSEYCEAQCWETDKRSYPDLVFECYSIYNWRKKKTLRKYDGL